MMLDEKRVNTTNGNDFETIMIEISLAEYRYLVYENARMSHKITTLEKENDVLKNMR